MEIIKNDDLKKYLTYNTVKNLYRSSVDHKNTQLIEKLKSHFPEFIKDNTTLDKPIPFLMISDNLKEVEVLQHQVVEFVAKTLELNLVIKTDLNAYDAQPNELVLFKPSLIQAEGYSNFNDQYYGQADNFKKLQQTMNTLASLNASAAGVVMELNDTDNFKPITQNFLLDFIRNEQSYHLNSENSSEAVSLKNITILANASNVEDGPFANSFHVANVEPTEKEIVLDRISSLRNEHNNNNTNDVKLKNN